MRRVPVRVLHAGLRADGEPAARTRIPIPDDDEIRHYLSGNLCRCARLSGDHRGREACRAQRCSCDGGG